MTTVVYRIAENKWNIENPPWSGSIGIERVEVCDDGSELYAVPAIVCWFTRGDDTDTLPRRVVEALNARS